MPLYDRGWRPTRITRYIQGFATSTSPVRVDTDLGEGYLKAMGNSEGPHALACEFVGTCLADWLGIPTFDFSIIEVSEDDEIPFVKGGKARPGPAFISRAEKGLTWGGSIRQLKLVTNPSVFSALIVIDTWTLNLDRCAPDRKRVNRDNVFFIQSSARKNRLELLAMDFTHAFRHGQDINRRIAFIERIQDERIYGLFPEFESFLNRQEVRRLAAALGRFRREDANGIIQAIPAAWEVEPDGRLALANLITDRAHFLAERIESILWPPKPQLEFEGGIE